MISVVFLGITAFIFVSSFVINKLSISDKRAVLIENLILLIAGYSFIAFSDWRFILVLFAMSFTTWFFAGKKCWFVGVIVAVGALAFFKYSNFFAESFGG